MYSPGGVRGATIPLVILISLTTLAVRQEIRKRIIGLLRDLTEIREAWRRFRRGGK